MMLDHVDLAAAAERVRAAVAQVLLRPEPRTPDLGGTATTAALGRAVQAALTSGKLKEEGGLSGSSFILSED